MIPLPRTLAALAVAISHAEGYYRTGTIPNRLNNPGDIVVSGHFEKFPNSLLGFASLVDDLRIKLTNRSHTAIRDTSTIRQLADVWASTSTTDERAAWASDVARLLTILLATPVTVNTQLIHLQEAETP
jgi:hypothetical protein